MKKKINITFPRTVVSEFRDQNQRLLRTITFLTAKGHID